MITTDAFVDLLKDVVPLLNNDALEVNSGITKLVKDIVDDCIYS